MSHRPIAVLTLSPAGEIECQASIYDPSEPLHKGHAQVTAVTEGYYQLAALTTIEVEDHPCTDTLRERLEEALPFEQGPRRIIIDLPTGQTFADRTLMTGERELSQIAPVMTSILADPQDLPMPNKLLRLSFENRMVPGILEEIAAQVLTMTAAQAHQRINAENGWTGTLLDVNRLIVAAINHVAALRRDTTIRYRIEDFLGTLRVAPV